MIRQTTVLILACSFLIVGCMGHAPNPVQTYQYGDEQKSCQFLRNEVSDIECQIDKKYQEKKTKTTSNVLLGVTGAVLFWPALFFMDLKGAEKVEIDSLESRRKALVRIAMDKDCEWPIGKNYSGDYWDDLRQKDMKEFQKASTEKTIVAVTPSTPEEFERVYVGILTNLEEKYVSHLIRRIERRPDREIIVLAESIGCEKLNPNNAKSLARSHQIDMIVCVRGSQFYTGQAKAHTRLLIPGRSMRVLKPIELGTYADPGLGWEEKLVDQQLRDIELVIDMAKREKERLKSR